MMIGCFLLYSETTTLLSQELNTPTFIYVFTSVLGNIAFIADEIQFMNVHS